MVIHLIFFLDILFKLGFLGYSFKHFLLAEPLVCLANQIEILQIYIFFQEIICYSPILPSHIKDRVESHNI